MLGFLDVIGRRRLLLGAVLLACAAVSPVRADDADNARAAAWVIGHNLSLAGLINARGDGSVDPNKYLNNAKGAAEALGVTIPDLPAKKTDSVESLADVAHYLIAGEGWDVGNQITAKWGRDAGLLFEIAVKSNLLLALYVDGEDSGIGEVLVSRCTGLLPELLWRPLTDLLAKGSTQPEVQRAVFTMHDQVMQYLLRMAQT